MTAVWTSFPPPVWPLPGPSTYPPTTVRRATRCSTLMARATRWRSQKTASTTPCTNTSPSWPGWNTSTQNWRTRSIGRSTSCACLTGRVSIDVIQGSCLEIQAWVNHIFVHVSSFQFTSWDRIEKFYWWKFIYSFQAQIGLIVKECHRCDKKNFWFFILVCLQIWTVIIIPCSYTEINWFSCCVERQKMPRTWRSSSRRNGDGKSRKSMKEMSGIIMPSAWISHMLVSLQVLHFLFRR